MSKPEDRTFNTIRILSEKEASKNQGSIVTTGGLFVNKNIECCDKIIASELVVRGLTKIAGDISIGGRIYCPGLYSVDDEMFRFKKNLVPAVPLLDCDKIGLGTYREPWEQAFIKCIKTVDIESSTICVGMNQIGNPSFQISSEETNINNRLNIINPDTNTVMLTSSNNAIETFVPIYCQWNSFRAIELTYNPNNMLHLSTSIVLLNTDGMSDLSLYFDANMVPPSTKIKVYFIKHKLGTKANYKLEILRFKKKYIFTSTVPTKKISLFFMENCVYLL
jgi:hypothetical protein